MKLLDDINKLEKLLLKDGFMPVELDNMFAEISKYYIDSDLALTGYLKVLNYLAYPPYGEI